jgi:hypothetical protein
MAASKDKTTKATPRVKRAEALAAKHGGAAQYSGPETFERFQCAVCGGYGRHAHAVTFPDGSVGYVGTSCLTYLGLTAPGVKASAGELGGPV